jgi:hypothetical protein
MGGRLVSGNAAAGSSECFSRACRGFENGAHHPYPRSPLEQGTHGQKQLQLRPRRRRRAAAAACAVGHEAPQRLQLPLQFLHRRGVRRGRVGGAVERRERARARGHGAEDLVAGALLVQGLQRAAGGVLELG